MSATAELSFAEMLDANERETAKWQSWFERQPAELLDLPLGIAMAKDVREFLLHIFAVELRYAEPLTGVPVTEYETLPTGSVAELFGIGERAKRMYRGYLAAATDEDLGIVMEFPSAPRACCARASGRCSFTRCCTACGTGRSWRRRCARRGYRQTGVKTF